MFAVVRGSLGDCHGHLATWHQRMFVEFGTGYCRGCAFGRPHRKAQATQLHNLFLDLLVSVDWGGDGEIMLHKCRLPLIGWFHPP